MSESRWDGCDILVHSHYSVSGQVRSKRWEKNEMHEGRRVGEALRESHLMRPVIQKAVSAEMSDQTGWGRSGTLVLRFVKNFRRNGGVEEGCIR